MRWPSPRISGTVLSLMALAFALLAGEMQKLRSAPLTRLIAVVIMSVLLMHPFYIRSLSSVSDVYALLLAALGGLPFGVVFKDSSAGIDQ